MFLEDGTLWVRVSDMGDWKAEALVAAHEILEAILCKISGVAESDVMAFDIKFEKERGEGKHGPNDEPGNAEDAPYRSQHGWASIAERFMAKLMGVDFDEYDDKGMSL